MENTNEKKSENKNTRLIITEWATLAGIVIACFLFLHAQIRELDGKIERQGARTDRLYEMFIDLLKEQRK